MGVAQTTTGLQSLRTTDQDEILSDDRGIQRRAVVETVNAVCDVLDAFEVAALTVWRNDDVLESDYAVDVWD
jgi:hypothetical protein